MEGTARAGSIRWVQCALLAALALLLLMPLSRAEANTIARGKTHLKLDRTFSMLLQREGIEVRPAQLAKGRNRLFTLPISGGQIDPGNAFGAVIHDGGLKFKLGKRTATLRDLTLDTAKKSVRARLGHKRLRIASVGGFSFSRNGFGNDITVRTLKLSRDAAAALNTKLHLRGVFKPGLLLGSASSTVEPEWDTASGSLLLSYDESFLAKLKSLGVELSPFAAQVVGSNPLAYSAPLLNGYIYPQLDKGSAVAEAGFRMQPETAGPEAPPGPMMSWLAMGLDFETNKLQASVDVRDPSGAAKFDNGPTASLNMAGATVSVNRAARTVTITNLRATLEAHTADLINETFAKPKGKGAVFAGGDPLGTFSVTMQGR